MPTFPCHKWIHSQSGSKPNYRRAFYGLENHTFAGEWTYVMAAEEQLCILWYSTCSCEYLRCHRWVDSSPGWNTQARVLLCFVLKNIAFNPLLNKTITKQRASIEWLFPVKCSLECSGKCPSEYPYGSFRIKKKNGNDLILGWDQVEIHF